MAISALSTVRADDDPVFLDEALQSLLGQTLAADEVVLVHDGPTPKELRSLLGSWEKKLPLKQVPLKEPAGLGNAMNAGINACSHDLVARFDVDDVNRPERFKVQRDYLERNKKVSAVGSCISEFTHAPNDLGRARRMLHSSNAIRKYARRQRPIIHTTAMVRKDVIYVIGGYPNHIPFMDDYCLWLNMLANGKSLANVQDILVDCRVGDGAAVPNKALAYLQAEMTLYHYKRRIGFASGADGFFVFLSRALSTIDCLLKKRKVQSAL